MSGTFTFGADCGADGTFTGTVTITAGADASTTIEDIPVGAVCSVTETDTPQPPAGYAWQAPTYAGNPATIPSDGAATVTVTNPLAQIPADVAVTKTVDDAEPNVGDTVTFTVTATNDGPADATGVAISDGLPAGLEFVSATASGTTSYDQATGIWTIGTLAVGDSETLEVTATVTLPGTLTNTATVTASDQPDPDPSNNTAGAAVNANPSADIQVLKTVDDPAPLLGAQATFTLTVANAGPDAATDVVLTDPTPAGLTFVAADAPCASGFPCALGTLASGASVTVQVTYAVDADATGAITNAATVGAGTPDPNDGNNGSSVTVPVQEVTPVGSADLQVVKTGPASAQPGATVAYQIVVVNNGPSDVPDAVVDDPTPAGLTFVSASAPCQGGFPCAIGAIANGASVTLTVTYQVQAGFAGDIVNTASANSPTVPDPVPSNNQGSVSTPVAGGDNGHVAMPVPVDAHWMLALLTLLLVGGGAWAVQRRE